MEESVSPLVPGEPEVGRGGMPIVGMDQVGLPALAAGEFKGGQREKNIFGGVASGVGVINRVGGAQGRAVDEIDRRAVLLEQVNFRLHRRAARGNRGTGDGFHARDQRTQRGVQRQNEPDVVSHPAQPRRQRSGEVRQTPDFYQRRRLGG